MLAQHENHESWKKHLSAELHEFQELDQKQHHNQEELDRVWSTIFVPVITQFVDDAKQDGMTTSFNNMAGNRSLHFITKGKSATFQIVFQLVVSPSRISISANSGGSQSDFLPCGKEPNAITQEDVARYLIGELRRIKPKG